MRFRHFVLPNERQACKRKKEEQILAGKTKSEPFALKSRMRRHQMYKRKLFQLLFELCTQLLFEFASHVYVCLFSIIVYKHVRPIHLRMIFTVAHSLSLCFHPNMHRIQYSIDRRCAFRQRRRFLMM